MWVYFIRSQRGREFRPFWRRFGLSIHHIQKSFYLMMIALNFAQFRFNLQVFGIEFFVLFQFALMALNLSLICRLPFVRSLLLIVKLVVKLSYHLWGYMLWVVLEKSISKIGVSLFIHVKLASLSVLFLVERNLLIAESRSFGRDWHIIVALFFSEGRAVIFHFITKNILLISSSQFVLSLIKYSSNNMIYLNFA